MPDCLSIETLRSWLADELSSNEREQVGVHVAGCAVCQSQLDTETNENTLRGWLQIGANSQIDDADLAITEQLLSKCDATPPRQVSVAEKLSGKTTAVASFSEPESDIGRIGSFRLLDELGRGGMGIVYRAWDESLGRAVAVKVLLPEHAGAADRLRLVREAQLASRFQNDHAVTIHAVVDPPDSVPYLVMEYVNGPTLAELVSSGRRPPPRELAVMVAQAALALDAAHAAGLVHRDVKPSNILIDTTTGRAKITDFGVARNVAATGTITREGTLAGTPAYMSPEQARGERDLDARTDIYSLGASLFEGLTGQPPFAGALHAILRRINEEDPIPPRRFDHEIPADLETICLKAMAKEPGQRYQTAHALADDLNRWLRDEPIHARPATRLERAGRWCRRNPRVALLSSALAIALAAGFLLVVWQWRRAEYQAHRAELLRQTAEANLNTANANFAHARRAVDQFYTRFYEQGVLGVPGLEKIRHEVLGEMLQYYKDFLDQHRDDSALRRELAESCERLGRLTFDQGNKSDGLSLLRTAARDFEQLLRDSSGNRDRALLDRLVVCLNVMGVLERALGEFESARKTYQRAIDLLKELISEYPDELQNHSRLASVYGNLASLLAVGFRDKGAGRASYLQALEIQKEMVRKDPANIAYRNDLALTYHNLAFVAANEGEVLKLCEQAIEIRKQLIEQEPTNLSFRRNLARTYEIKGMHERKIGRPTEGIHAVKEACRLLRQVVAEQPTALSLQGDLAQALDNLGVALAEHGSPQEGRDAIVEAMGIYKKLVHANPSDPAYQHGVRSTQDNLAEVTKAIKALPPVIPAAIGKEGSGISEKRVQGP